MTLERLNSGTRSGDRTSYTLNEDLTDDTIVALSCGASYADRYLEGRARSAIELDAPRRASE